MNEELGRYKKKLKRLNEELKMSRELISVDSHIALLN